MKKIFLVLIALIAMSIVCVKLTPGILQKTSEKVLSETLQTKVTVGDVSLSVINGEIAVSNVVIKDYPKFSDADLLELKKLVLKVNPASLLTSTITINEFTIDGIDVKLTGGIKDNSLTEIEHVLALNEHKKAQEEATHVNETAEQHSGHNHQHKKNVKIRVEALNIDNIKIAAHITEPFNLGEKQLKLAGLNLKNIGGEKGVSINNAIAQVTKSLNIAIKAKIEELLPAQKAYEETKHVLEKGLETGKEKADELLNKYFK